MTIAHHIAAKDYVCDLCGRKIPQGHRYWRDFRKNAEGDPLTDRKEHTNCEAYSPESARAAQ
jgi:hypothetical protein